MSEALHDEKVSEINQSASPDISIASIQLAKDNGDDEFEIFKKAEGTVDFRTVSWIRASVIFLKIIFAVGVLSIPSSMYTLGAFPGAVNVVGWTLFNTYGAIIQGNFRRSHPGCHTIADMADVVGGPILKEIVGFLFIAAYIICAAAGIIGVSTALNALSVHAVCTVWFSLVGTVVIAVFASVRKFAHIGWLTWVGFLTVFVAVFVVVVGAGIRERPAAAPQTGDFDLGYRVIGSPTFVAGITASVTIFLSSAGTSAFLPVISEMRKPKDYNKAVYLCMGFVTVSYLTFSLVLYRFCGQWVASPSLGSAGPVVKKVAYGIALAGLIVSACLYIHVSAKYVFVRILRNSKHLQSNSVIHWGTWLSCTIGLSALGFILASAIPIFNYLLALVGSVCFGPLAIILPAWLWIYDNREFRVGSLMRKLAYWTHWLVILIGVFITVGGTYGVVVQIINAYHDGQIDSAFSCADNSGSV